MTFFFLLVIDISGNDFIDYSRLDVIFILILACSSMAATKVHYGVDAFSFRSLGHILDMESY
jgi:hypothetical protein